MKSKKQSVPVVIEKYFRQTAGRHKGELTWSEGKASKTRPYTLGKRTTHTSRLTIQAPTALPGLLTAIAKTLGQSAHRTCFQFYTCDHGVCVYALSSRPASEGKPAVAIVYGIVSPMDWHRDPDGMWMCLPDRMTSFRDYSGLAELLSEFPTGSPMEGWVWKRRINSDHERKSLIAIRTATKIMGATELTAADAKSVSRLVDDLIRAARAA